MALVPVEAITALVQLIESANLALEDDLNVAKYSQLAQEWLIYYAKEADEHGISMAVR